MALARPVHIIRRISGHAPGSKEFYLYVIIAQDYINQHILKAYELMKPKELELV